MIEEVVHRLHQRQFNIVITKLPIESIQSVGPRRFRLLKNFLFPDASNLEEIKEQCRQMNNNIIRLAKNISSQLLSSQGLGMGSTLYIYGVLVLIAWRRVLECWPLSSSNKKVCQGTSRWNSLKEWSYLCKASAEVRSLAGVTIFTPQPVLQLSDTTHIFLLIRLHFLDWLDWYFM